MSTLTQPAIRDVDADVPVRIDVLLVRPGDHETISVTGPVRSAVRSAFAHPRLAAALTALQMDADRLAGRILARWQDPDHATDADQHWMKTDGSTTVRWWVNRDAPA